MLKDIPYSAIKKNARAYEIMLLRDQHGNTYADIAKEYGISVERARQQYVQTKTRQIRLYVNRIAFVYGHENTSQIKKVDKAACECYWDWTYACAYLEKEYKDILDEYRAGEPGMPAAFIKQMPPFKAEFSKRTINRVIKMREDENMSYVTIAKKLHMTRAKAERIYEWYYHEKFMACIKAVEALEEKANLPLEERTTSDIYYRKYSNAKRYYDAILQDHPELLPRKRKKPAIQHE